MCGVSALCHTTQHSGCQSEECYGFVLFLPFSHCSNCSPVFLRQSNVHLQERRQNPLIWSTKAGLRKEKLGKLLALVNANFCAKNHPCGWACLCSGLQAHTQTATAGGHLQPQLPTVCTSTKSLSKQPGQEFPQEAANTMDGRRLRV